MVTIYVAARPKPDEARGFERVVEQVARDARALAGCTRYQWFRDTATDGSYVVYGEFGTRQSFEAYQQSAVVAQIGSELMPLLEGPPQYYHLEGEIFESGSAD